MKVFGDFSGINVVGTARCKAAEEIRVERRRLCGRPLGSEKGCRPCAIFTHLRRPCQIPHTTTMGHERDDAATLRTKGRGRDPFNLRGSKRRGGKRRSLV